VFASNQVIGEAYIALQHHYGVSKPDARTALASVLSSGLVAPLNGPGVFAALEATSGCGLLDRLITDDYRRAGLITLTLDRKMAVLPQARRL
jgi:predicted nucleic acid-binding protein